MSEALTLPASRAAETIRFLARAALLAASRLGGVAAQMGVQLAVGAVAGPAGIGTLQLHMAWTSVAAELLGAGEPTRALRNTAVWQSSGQRSRIGKSLRRCGRLILRNSAILAVALFACTFMGLVPANWAGNNGLLLSIVLAAPLFALGRVCAETLKALDRPLLAVSLENMASPAVLLAFCLYLLLGDIHAQTSLILAAAVVGTAACALGLGAATVSTLGAQGEHPPTGHVHNARPIHQPREQMHFWLSGLLNIAFLQLPFLIMPWLVANDDIGRFAVAHKLVNIITTLLILLAALYGPRFATAAATGSIARCRTLLWQTQGLSIALFLPAWLLMLSLANPLASAFSLPSDSLFPLLLILGAGQFINAATGLSGVLLNMSGAAHLEMKLLLASLAITTLAATMAGSTYGVLGVAAAISVGISLRNLLAYSLTRIHLHNLEQIHP